MFSRRESILRILAIFCMILIMAGTQESPEPDVNHGPTFIHEPPNHLDFTNTTGAKLECRSQAVPEPSITWITADGTPVTNLPRVREVMADGTLVFPPFAADDFKPDVHEAVYKCVATNPFGVIVSRPVRLKAVVLKNYDIHVYDVHVIAGNTAVMRCNIPTDLTKFIRVTGWIRNDTDAQAPQLITGGDRYSIMPSGDLHIQHVQLNDGGATFACQTLHRLTGETRTSASVGRLVVTAPQGSVSPRIEVTSSTVLVRQGETAVLPCVAQGYPIPNSIWFAKLNKGQLLPIHIGERVQQTTSALIIRNTQISDSTTYVCAVNNGIGNEKQETILTVAAPLSAHIEPARLLADIGKPAVFRCTISGFPVASVIWLKNGKPLAGSREKSTITEDVLRLETLQLEDRGMYQCIVQNNLETAQATAELLYGDIAPEFRFTFGEKTLEPGPAVSLQCVATGTPPPQITWFLDEQPLPESERIFVEEVIDINGKVESVLNISNIQTEDGGVYKCAAVNKVGSIEHRARLNIHGPPSIRPMPKISVVDGTNIRMTCPVTGYPITSISWEKSGRALPFNLRQLVFPNGTLMIGEVQREADSGKYTCIVRNNQRQSARGEVEVAVLVPPKITPFSFQDELLREGARARLQCVVSEGDVPLAIKWLKDGKPIPFDLGVTIRELDEFSSILTIAVVTSRHNGNYTCMATNDAASVQHTAELSVNVPPKIVPFTFQDEHLFEGMLVRVSCVVSRGDLPLTIRWEKDGKEIAKDQGITIRNFDEYSSVLSIDPLTPAHQGNYTCYASNTAATATHSAQLVVKVPPKWVVEPADTAVLAGNNVMMHCMAEGVPEPTITWMKAQGGFKTSFNYGTSPGDQHEPILDGMEFRLLHNRSLYIEKASNFHRGHYVCQAANGIGRDLSTVVYLTVDFPPEVEAVHENLTVRKGENIHLKCQARGDQPLNFTWFAGTHQVDPVTDGRYKMNVIPAPNMTASELIVVDADRRDGTNFTCVAHNPYGSDRRNISVTVQEVPDLIKTPILQDLGNRSIRISWTSPFDGNSPVRHYYIQYKKVTENWEKITESQTVNSTETSAVVKGLQPATHYNFRVIAENEIGRSEPSELINATVPEEAPSGSPQEVEVEALDTQTIKVTWKPPLREHWNGKLRGYYVGYQVVGASAPYSFKTVEAPEESARNMSLRISGLKNFTKYSVVVQAYNDKGRGPASREVLTMTSEDVPRKAPLDLQCSTLSSENILVYWQPPPPQAVTGILRGYKVYYKPVYDGFEDEPPPLKELTPHENVTLEKLNKYVNYSISVLAYTRAGEGPQTEPVYCFTFEDAPDPPAEIRALRASRSSVLVSWKSPIHPNGNITHYTVYAKKLDDNPAYIEITPYEVPPEELHLEVPELFQRWRYEFWVTASTAVGEGPPSQIASASPDGPAVPANMGAYSVSIITPWKKEIKLSCLSVGIPVPDKTWIKDSSTVRENDRTTILANGTLHIKSVLEVDTGNYTCLIKNRFGEDRIQHSLRVLVPPATPVLMMIDTSFVKIELEWTHSGDGGQPVLGFILSYKQGEEPWQEIRLPPTTFSFTLDNLQCGTMYKVHVAAFNRIGAGNASETLTIITNGTAPEAPDQMSLIEEGINTATIHLSAWSNDDCPILHFLLEYKMKYNPDWIKLSDNLKLSEEKFVISGLLPAMGYNLRMIAYNNAGSTTVEFEFTTLTRIGATVMTEVILLDEKRDLLSYIDMELVIPVAGALAGLLVIIACMCVCVAKTKGANKRMKGRGKIKDRGNQNKQSKEPKETPTKNAHLRRINPAQPGPASANPPQNAPEDLTPYATFQLVDQPSQSAFNAFNQLPAVPEQQPPPVRSSFIGPDLQGVAPQFPRPEIGFRSPVKELDIRNMRAIQSIPTAPPMSDTSSVTYDTQMSPSFRHSPIVDQRFPPGAAGRIKGRIVSLQPGKPQQPGEGSAVPTMETTFIFPNAPDEGCIASDSQEAPTDVHPNPTTQ